MSQDKSYITQNTLIQSLNNIVTDRAPPLHSHNQFIQKFQKQLRGKKNISFGSLQIRKSRNFSPKRIQQKPGPGHYDLQVPKITNKSYDQKSVPFGIKIQRFKNTKIRTIPGPGAYFKEYNTKQESIKIKNNRIRYIKHKNILKDTTQNVELPGPGTYQIGSKDNIDKRRQLIKEKLKKIKQNRKNKINHKKCITFLTYQKKSITKNVQERRNQKSVFVQIEKKKQIIYHSPNKPLERNVLKDKTNKYLPHIKFQQRDNFQRKDINFFNYQNSFISKNDKAFKAHFLTYEMSNPGIYHKEKPILAYDKKSSFFVSESKRKVF